MSIDELKSSGLLELYVIGEVTESEELLIEKAIAANPILKQEIFEIEKALEVYAMHHTISPSGSAQPMLLAMLDYSERVKNGEVIVAAPSLNPKSKKSEFNTWITRPDFQEPEEFGPMYGKIISADEQKTTMLVWLRFGAPDEVHTDELESFLILEGSCNLIIGDKTHSLVAGDYLTIPLHINHRVEVTSDIPCKLILERAAA